MGIFIILFTIPFLLDLLTKGWIRNSLDIGQEIPILPFFSLVHIQNTGVAFGMLQGRNTILMIFAGAAIIFILFYGYKNLKQDKYLAWIMALVAGGAAGNVLDRIRFGAVTDFMDFYAGSHHWPAFNVADSSVCVGAGLLILHSMKHAKQGEN